MLDRPRKPDFARNDAIHRAVLSGLLSNIGQRTDPHEYTGARGTHFYIFPGSSLFKAEPPWLMAAEIVETTRLYARTVARIQPEWIESIGEHLLKRSYTDPHWNPDTAHVVAYEKVTLFGLVVIPQRPVHYGPIDPVLSREIFIHALVEGEYHTDAPFWRHNQRLIDEIQALEAKSRARDVLVGHDIRFDFYDAHIPAGIHNGPAFEKWRNAAERHHSRLLYMTRRDLMLHSASGITQEYFPDSLIANNIRVPLEYHFEPGHPADGVTATVPLHALTQLPADRFEWLVPGLLMEKITALIKTLPKELRVNFVPAPDFAQLAFDKLKPGDGSLIDALALFLGTQKGIVVPRDAFDPSSLLDHLHMNFKVVDQHAKVLAEGRNLEQIRQKLGVQVRATFNDLSHPQFTRDNITKWDFGDLPLSVTISRHGLTLTAYPALLDTTEPSDEATKRRSDEGDRRQDRSVIENRKSKIENPLSSSRICLRLLDSPDAARLAHAAGLRRLFILELRDELKYLAGNIPNFREMALQYAPLGSSEDLKSDIVGETINRAFLFDSNIRTAMEFELRKEAGRRHRLIEVTREVATTAAQILAAYHQVALQLSKPAIPAFAASIGDVRTQVAALLPKGFLTTTPDEWLTHLPRFLKALSVRLQKLWTAGHSRDQLHMAEITPFWQLYVDRLKRNNAQRIHDPALDHFRWMIEELRVSLFSQELKTSIPVSPRRLEKQWESVRQ